MNLDFASGLLLIVGGILAPRLTLIVFVVLLAMNGVLR